MLLKPHISCLDGQVLLYVFSDFFPLILIRFHLSIIVIVGV